MFFIISDGRTDGPCFHGDTSPDTLLEVRVVVVTLCLPQQI